MSVQRMPRLRNNLLRAGLLSLAAHLGVLGVIALRYQSRPSSGQASWGWMTGWTVPRDAEEATTVDLVAMPAGPSEAALEMPEVVAAGMVADNAHKAEKNQAPQLGHPHERLKAAADEGDTRPRSGDVAQRRDRTQLRARLTDGAAVYQIAREKTASASSSPQPERQEPRVGIGDSSRTRVTGAQTLPTPALPIENTPSPDEEVADPSVASDAERARAGHDSRTGQGPLDAEQGVRRFAVPVAGVARDSALVRAASDERRPGLVDLSAGGVARTAGTGHGPGTAPGAAVRPTTGAAPNAYGAPVHAAYGSDVDMNTIERQYLRHELEIRRRVSSVLKFPPRLALMLEQGETIVYFVVRPDGRLAGKVQVKKSAGFGEFDDAAVTAVERAAPFPRMERSLSVSMRVPFENPVVR